MKDTDKAKELNDKADAILKRGNEAADRIYKTVLDSIR